MWSWIRRFCSPPESRNSVPILAPSYFFPYLYYPRFFLFYRVYTELYFIGLYVFFSRTMPPSARRSSKTVSNNTPSSTVIARAASIFASARYASPILSRIESTRLSPAAKCFGENLPRPRILNTAIKLLRFARFRGCASQLHPRTHALPI